MILTRKQEEGLKIAVARYHAKERYTVISGYAGSGKSTLVSFIVQALGVAPEDICYCAFTGKASKILGLKTNANAITAHKLLYEFKPLPTGGFKRERKLALEYKVIIVDECGMLPLEMVKDLLSHRDIYVIFLGDPGQLPPISKKDDNHLLDSPHVFLDEIMRQAQDSGIIRLSMLIREGKSFDNFKSDEAIVLPSKDFVDGMLTWSDISICATNKTRVDLNNYCRQKLGYTNVLEEGELVMNLRNNWDIITEDGEALTNGTLGTIHDIYETFWLYPSSIDVPNNRIELLCGEFTSEIGGSFGRLYFDKQMLLTGVPSLNRQQIYKIRKNKKIANQVPEELAYGQVATCWKFQGSQANRVLGIEEGFPYDREEHKRFLYTLVTRAIDKCVLVTKE